MGYMLQLAEAYSPYLTLRENLVYAAMMRLPHTMPLSAKMERAEQILDEINLRGRADVVVGSATGGGLSGGQKRLLMFGIEMVALPSMLFLDEPTSGLDSSSSLSLIKSCKNYCANGRSIVLTIHQPREEIFTSFDTLLLLYKGSVAFFGPPQIGASYLMKYATTIKHVSVKFEGNPGDIVIDALNLKEEHDDGKAESIGPEAVKVFYECGLTLTLTLTWPHGRPADGTSCLLLAPPNNSRF